VQVAYVVDDPEAAAHVWAERHGAGPFILSEHIQVTEVVHREIPSTFDHTSAYGQWGSIMVELFTQHGDAPSVVRERFSSGEGGLHHLAVFVDDLDAALAQAPSAGLDVAMTARSRTTRFAFLDAIGTLGHYWELYEPSPALLGFYELVRSSSLGWNGEDPVRRRG
jgi:catechol 2,3-dioxygenase-like lactoylglutathione lyase family enzyme